MNIKVSLQAAVDFSDPPDCRVAKHTVDLNQKKHLSRKRCDSKLQKQEAAPFLNHDKSACKQMVQTNSVTA